MSLLTFIATTQDQSGRVATAAGGAALAAGLFTGDLTGVTFLATTVATGGGLLTTRFGEHNKVVRATASTLYAAPGVSLLAVLVAERMAAGISLWEIAAVAAWTAGTWIARPARLARRLLGQQATPAPAPVQEAAQQPFVEQVVETHPLAIWWAENVATDIAPRTRLADPERTSPTSMRGVITSTVPGEPVPSIDLDRLSARMDIQRDLINVTPVPGRGAGVQLLTVGTAPMALTPEQEWAEIARAAMPGCEFLEVKTYPIEQREEVER
jgi:hypothetical protein